MSNDFQTPRVYVLRDPGMAWPLAQDLASTPGAETALVKLDGRTIEAARLIECWRWLFDA
ncbi:hypothetical protein [Microbacterium lacticum]|uniref:hypothetical protein n=1 Tax=Microbacterium lacticum TaxID=33885 RepID=UPI0028D5642C|nr:hypothetical protein [Microbacterium lacticum]